MENALSIFSRSRPAAGSFARECVEESPSFNMIECLPEKIFATSRFIRISALLSEERIIGNSTVISCQTFANNGLDSELTDLGRFVATKREGDKGKFAVPSLRNVSVTAPYMHDGRFKTLEEVVEHYSGGVKTSGTLDPNIAKHPVDGLHLSREDKQALVAFLKALTDQKFIRNEESTLSSVEASLP